MKTLFWSNLDRNRVQCGLCCRNCVLLPGERGFCGVREHRNGELRSLIGNTVAAVHADPVEKKPLYHYLPGSKVFSVGTMGCNFACTFCQNAGISRTPARTGTIGGTPMQPEVAATAALQTGCAAIAFTYNEPTVFFEWMLEAADAAATVGLGRILVSNGYQSRECLNALRSRITAANIDLKAFTDRFYRERCGGARLAPVLDTLKRAASMNWWLEVTTLLIPGLNDDPAELRDAARFIRDELGPHVPWHLSAFHPCFELTDRPPTSPQAVLRACSIGLAEGLWFVYPGNTAFGLPTCCPGCKKNVVENVNGRRRALVKEDWNGVCSHCGTTVPGIWQAGEFLRQIPACSPATCPAS